MSRKFKFMTVVGTRPELIRLSAVIKALDNHPEIIHLFVHTGQNNHPQLSDVFYQNLNLRLPDYQLQGRQATRKETLQKMQEEVKAILLREKPDAFVVLGDTDSALTSDGAKALGIPIFHMEAGNRCFDRRSPEEKNRIHIDRIATVNLPYASEGKKHLQDESLNQPTVVTGSPLREVLTPIFAKINHKKILQTFHLTPKEFLIWSTHRAEHVDNAKAFLKTIHCLISIAKAYPQYPVLVTSHPRFKQQLDRLTINLPSNVQLHEPFGLSTYLSLQYQSLAVLSDSGSIHEEADIIGFHAVHLRRRHERPEAEAIPVTYLSEFKTKAILKHLEQIQSQHPKKNRVIAYRQKAFSKVVIRTMLSFLKKVKT